MQECGCRGLFELAGRGCRGRILEAGGVEVICAALRAHQASAGVQESGRSVLDDIFQAALVSDTPVACCLMRNLNFKN